MLFFQSNISFASVYKTCFTEISYHTKYSIIYLLSSLAGIDRLRVKMGFNIKIMLELGNHQKDTYKNPLSQYLFKLIWETAL